MQPESEKHDSTRGEFERLLLLAEDLNEKIRQAERRIDLIRSAQVGSAILSVVSVTVLFFLHVKSFEVLVLGVLGIFASYVVVFQTQVRRRRSDTRRDRYALKELIGLLRETEDALATQGKWSTLDRAEVRIRISRFAIDPTDKYYKL